MPAFCTETDDLALKSLIRDIFPLLGVQSLHEYRQKFQKLGDILVEGAKPQCLKLDRLEPQRAKLVSSRSSPVAKPWKAEGGSSTCHVSTNLPSLNGEDSHDWCETSPRPSEGKLPQKLLFRAPNSARAQEPSKQICFGHDEKEELTAAP